MLSWQNKQLKTQKDTTEMSELSYELTKTTNKEILAVDAILSEL